MQAFTALSMLVITVVTLTLGVRLLLVARRTRQLPEFAFGLGFLTGGLGSALGQTGRKLLWPEPTQLATFMNGFCFLLLVAGMVLLFLAVWKIYRPHQGWAAGLFWMGCVAGLVSFIVRWADGDYLTANIASRGMFVFHAARFFLFAWTAYEGFRYSAMLRRRVALGLAPPLVANQILLWAVSATAMVGTISVIMTCSYLMKTHPFDSPLAMFAITGFVMATAGTMWCAFWPPDLLRRWVESHTEVAA